MQCQNLEKQQITVRLVSWPSSTVTPGICLNAATISGWLASILAARRLTLLTLTTRPQEELNHCQKYHSTSKAGIEYIHGVNCLHKFPTHDSSYL